MNPFQKTNSDSILRKTLKTLSFFILFKFFSKVTLTSQINWGNPCSKKSTKGINQHATTSSYIWYYVAANNYLSKVNKRNTRTWCKICSKLTKKFEDISYLVLVSYLLTLSGHLFGE